ncbi:hypothetical protein KSP40_PGU013344 [Platanthera guangdongensis]|uniref:WRKY19-like zinc finger domain-containing protein n=1 Tax=Platanthera guangdongensis TaxID=2320717 RepID=A0ABR2M101_9ASPA
MSSRYKHFGSETGSQTDTTLRLVSPGAASGIHRFNSKGKKRKWEGINGVSISRHASLTLGLQCSPSTSESSKRSSGTVCTDSSAYVADEECSLDVELNFQLELDPKSLSVPKSPTFTNLSAPVMTKPAVNLQLSLSVGPSVSAITSEVGAPAHNIFQPETLRVNFHGGFMDDGSVSSCRTGGSTPSPQIDSSASHTVLPASNFDTTKLNLAPNQELMSIIVEAPRSPVDCTSGNIGKQCRSISSKNCQFMGCSKGARGASGLCIAHGGGRRCQKAGCHKGAEGKTIYCKLHGGGRRCEHLGCTKSAEGRTDFCIAHGGGRRCSKDGCSRASRGKSGLCIRHGGGRRCRKDSCTKSAEGQSGLCIAHGGGRRCQYPDCTKGAQGSTMFCKAHGGGKRCTFPECGKGAEGSTSYCKGHGGGKRCLFQGGGLCPKSVHGGTPFCVAHGGGKRCASLNCTKSARGRTDYCVRHGGGKRCQSDGCGKSAQGSTDFCKAHGGGKRCSWGQDGSDFGSGGPSCDRFSRGKGGLCTAHSALVQDYQVHGGETIGTLTAQKPKPGKADKMKGVVVEDDVVYAGWKALDQREFVHPIAPVKSVADSLPEGRVHGGSLMALLAKGALFDQFDVQAGGGGCSTSNKGSTFNMNYGFL